MLARSVRPERNENRSVDGRREEEKPGENGSVDGTSRIDRETWNRGYGSFIGALISENPSRFARCLYTTSGSQTFGPLMEETFPESLIRNRYPKFRRFNAKVSASLACLD